MLEKAAPWLLLPNAELRYCANFYSPNKAAQLFATLRAEIDWQQETIFLFGKRQPVPRLSALYGDSGLLYRYSNIEHTAHAWTPLLAALRKDVEGLTGSSVNSVLANLYRDGNDCNGWHADNEPELGSAPVIASISLGAARDFHFKHRELPQHSYRCQLAPGSVLIMAGAMQSHWLHQLPRRRRVSEARINLTFRQIEPV
ncbi:MAG: alpha-ketoglutarate-dependent dioxygenase AlkB [Pseudomonadales bacterium]|nr:alpha-ketoglutarate-dependent dioxygenase AlkB [Pseudomonadales bacterium]